MYIKLARIKDFLQKTQLQVMWWRWRTIVFHRPFCLRHLSLAHTELGPQWRDTSILCKRIHMGSTAIRGEAEVSKMVIWWHRIYHTKQYGEKDQTKSFLRLVPADRPFPALAVKKMSLISQNHLKACNQYGKLLNSLVRESGHAGDCGQFSKHQKKCHEKEFITNIERIFLYCK